jgi:SPP1 family predicted phage head-tail adaptor
MKRTGAGDLDQRLTLQSNAPTQPTEGISIDNWTDVATVWAKIEDLGGRESFQAAAVYAEADVKITIRYRDGVTPDMRGVCGSRVFNIIGPPVQKGRREWLLLFCEEVTGGG